MLFSNINPELISIIKTMFAEGGPAALIATLLVGLFKAITAFFEYRKNMAKPKLYKKSFDLSETIQKKMYAIRIKYGFDKVDLVQMKNGGYFANGIPKSKLSMLFEDTNLDIKSTLSSLQNTPSGKYAEFVKELMRDGILIEPNIIDSKKYRGLSEAMKELKLISIYSATIWSSKTFDEHIYLSCFSRDFLELSEYQKESFIEDCKELKELMNISVNLS